MWYNLTYGFETYGGMYMKYCTNCGAQLSDDARFCSVCGAAVAMQPPKKRVEQAGTVYKCPNCGEPLNSFVSTCPVCGAEIRGANTSDAIREFSSRLSLSKTDSEKELVINSFPVPSTKEDIFDFLIMAVSTLSVLQDSPMTIDTAAGQMNVANAWFTKVQQCQTKAEMLLRGNDIIRIDEMFTRASTSYQDIKLKYNRNQNRFYKKQKKKERKQHQINKLVVQQRIPYSDSTVVFKNKWIALFLCLSLGWLGGHKFYEGKFGVGLLYICTFGLFMIGWIIDCFALLCKPNPYPITKPR